VEKRSIKAAIAYIVLIQIFAVLLTAKVLSVGAIPEPYQPFGGETVQQATANTLLLLSLVIGVTLFFIFLVLKFRFLFKYAIIFLSLFAAFFITLFYSLVIMESLLAIPLTFAFVLILFYSLIKNIYPIVLFSIFLISAEIGSYFSLILLPPTLFILPIIFSIYDLWSVFFGPLRKLIELLTPKKRLKKQSKSSFGLFLAYIGGFGIGVGDLIFSAMLVSAAYVLLEFFEAMAVALAVNLGFFITLKLLIKYKRPLPALPLPMLLGTSIFILLYYL
jgi:presenilin-like A22 family membrane protease